MLKILFISYCIFTISAFLYYLYMNIYIYLKAISLMKKYDTSNELLNEYKNLYKQYKFRIYIAYILCFIPLINIITIYFIDKMRYSSYNSLKKLEEVLKEETL